ncbi:hypothetical protein K438DRAFT_416939 [Mycena galopus ATCC 62051]|nr:hypothetical protein K438DRAFT_416939 [Mycena galopus ATCC 62051]
MTGEKDRTRLLYIGHLPSVNSLPPSAPFPHPSLALVSSITVRCHRQFGSVSLLGSVMAARRSRH